MAKSFGGPYYDPFYGEKLKLQQKQSQGLLTTGAQALTPEQYAAAYEGILGAESAEKQAQRNYELQKKQMFLNAAIASKGQQGATTTGSPIAGALNLATLGLGLPKAITGATEGLQKLGILPTSTQPTGTIPAIQPSSYYDPSAAYASIPYADYGYVEPAISGTGYIPPSYDEYYGGYYPEYDLMADLSAWDFIDLGF